MVLYRAWAVDRFGLNAAKTWVLPSYYRIVEQDTFELSLDGLAAGEYTIKVTAETAYGVRSEALEAKVTVDGPNVLLNLPSRIRVLIERLIFIIKQIF